MQHPIGRFVRFDLMTTDADASRAFYTALFGWTSRRIVIEGFPAHVFFNGDDTIGALVSLGDAPIPAHWMPYVAVEDAHATCAAAEKAGGTVCEKPMLIPGQGTFSVVEDPEGAYISLMALIHPEKVPDYQMKPVGSFCWAQLMTGEAEAVLPFYRETFGWKTGPMPGQPDPVWTVGVAEGPQNTVGTIMQKPATTDAGEPNFWMSYIAVDDCAAAVDKAVSLGGTALVPPTDIGGMGRFAVLLDPTKAAFAVWQNARR